MHLHLWTLQLAIAGLQINGKRIEFPDVMYNTDMLLQCVENIRFHISVLYLKSFTSIHQVFFILENIGCKISIIEEVESKINIVSRDEVGIRPNPSTI